MNESKIQLIICKKEEDFNKVLNLLNNGLVFITEPIQYPNAVIFYLAEPIEEKPLLYKQVGYRMVNSHNEVEINNLLKDGYKTKGIYKDYIQLIKEVIE